MNSLHITSHNIQTINVSNCIITNTYSSTGAAGVALYIYNVRDYKDSSGHQSCLTTTTFTNCSFTGYSAAYINGGHHTFENCTFTSNGTSYSYDYSTYFKRYGNAITIHRTTEYMTVDIIGGSMSKTATDANLIEVVWSDSNNQRGVTERTTNSYNATSGYHFSYGSN